MALLFLGSVRSYAGKNLVALGLGRHLMDAGHGLAFMKPYGINPTKVGDTYTDKDAWMICQELGLDQTPGEACPILRTQDLLTQVLRGQWPDPIPGLRDKVEALSAGKDVTLLCGAGTLRSGAMAGLGGYRLILELGAKAVIVERYENDFFLDDLLSAAYRLGSNLAGVIINSVDPEMNAALEEQIMPFLAELGIPTLGVLASDSLMASVSVQELAEKLGAQVISGLRFMDRLVNRFLIGAMQVSHAASFFGGAHDFACIVGGDRPDMQMAAIQGGAACLILTGNFYPGEMILSQAEEHEVPVMVVRKDTFSTAHSLEEVRMQGSLAVAAKKKRAVELVKAGVDWEAFYRECGIAKP